MHLCFGSFSKTLLGCKKNNAVSKLVVGRNLLSFIIEDYTVGREDRCIYYFMNEERNLPKELKFQMSDMARLKEQFRLFLDKYISLDHERLLRDFRVYIQEDSDLPEQEKDRLLRLSENPDLPLFLAELFVFVVDNTNNKRDGARQNASKKHYTLRDKIDGTANNKALCKHAQSAIREQDAVALTYCLRKMTNNVYIAKALIVLSRDDAFTDNSKYARLWHRTFSKMQNDRYRYTVFEACLKTGYFKEHPELLLEPHMLEYANNKYIYDTLVLLCDLGLANLAEQYREGLTNTTYIKRLDEYLAR